MLKLISWNIAHRQEPWHILGDCDADLALLQEAGPPPPDIACKFDIDSEAWRTEGAGVVTHWRTALVKLNPRVQLDRIPTLPIADPGARLLAVSRLGAVAAAEAEDPDTRQKYTLISMYAPWESAHASAHASWIYADASAHRLVSDISVFVGRKGGHHVVAAGDLNILHGHGENGNPYWAARYQTVFDRLDAVGLRFVGPQFPDGRQADPWPNELPRASLNVPTFHHSRQIPATATRQLDFVFASNDIVHLVKVRALNLPEVWARAIIVEFASI